MKTMLVRHCNLCLVLICSLWSSSISLAQVTTQRVPESGLAPQAATDSKGRVHLIYFKGDPQHGDICYVRSDDGGKTFTPALRVNSQPNSALIIGTVRCPQIAIGRDDRVHVAWMGSSTATPRAKVTDVGNPAPMLYSRLNDQGDAFEPQRNLIAAHPGLDGGGSIAADDQGHVYVAWHAPMDAAGEADRAVWLTRSSDDGKTFDPEAAISPKNTGACGCCGLKIAAGVNGQLYVVFRTATDTVHRDSLVLASKDFGQTFGQVTSDAWNANICVMSTPALATQGDRQTIAAWETRGQIRYQRLTNATPAIAEVPGRGDRKHPAIAINKAGDFVIVWAEGPGWNRGGRVAWQAFDHNGKPTTRGSADGLPVWSQPTVFARRDGSFGIGY